MYRLAAIMLLMTCLAACGCDSESNKVITESVDRSEIEKYQESAKEAEKRMGTEMEEFYQRQMAEGNQ